MVHPSYPPICRKNNDQLHMILPTTTPQLLLFHRGPLSPLKNAAVHDTKIRCLRTGVFESPYETNRSLLRVVVLDYLYATVYRYILRCNIYARVLGSKTSHITELI